MSFLTFIHRIGGFSFSVSIFAVVFWNTHWNDDFLISVNVFVMILSRILTGMVIF